MAKTFDHLSGSTDGQPIDVSATVVGSAITVHTAGSSGKDYVTVQAYNTDTQARKLYLLWGTTTEAEAIIHDIPSQKGVQIVVPRGFIDNSGVIKAYAEVASKILLLGNVETIS